MESVSIRKAEIDASVELFARLRKLLVAGVSTSVATCGGRGSVVEVPSAVVRLTENLSYEYPELRFYAISPGARSEPAVPTCSGASTFRFPGRGSCPARSSC